MKLREGCSTPFLTVMIQSLIPCGFIAKFTKSQDLRQITWSFSSSGIRCNFLDRLQQNLTNHIPTLFHQKNAVVFLIFWIVRGWNDE